METVEKYKALQKLDKILDFFEKEKPDIQRLIKYKIFRDIIVQTILDFHLSGKKKDYRYYPWLEKIIEKKIEMYGF